MLAAEELEMAVLEEEAALEELETAELDDAALDDELETVSLVTTYKKELRILEKLKEGVAANIDWKYEGGLVTTVDGQELTEEQIQTQKEILENNIVLLTGSAGSGKSFSMKAMIKMLDNANKSYILLSPTAKAAKVLSSATERSASTIHRGLGVVPFGNGSYHFLHNEANPLLFDLVIVDEFSMVDTDLFYNLLKAIDFEHTKLLLIFDPAQLASVGPGNISYDMVSSGLFKTVALNKIFRYSEGGLITVATDTRNCKRFLPNSARYETTKFGKSFVFVPEDNESVVDCAVQLYATLLNRGNTFDDTILLSAQNKGPQGTVCINEKIQNQINPQPEEQRITFGAEDNQVEYRLDDIIIQTMNDYNSIVCDENGNYDEDENGEPKNTMLIANGETGRIVKVDKGFVVIKYGDYFIYRDKMQLMRTQLGYAISCHRSQGSGYKNVIIVAPSSHTWQLNSNLLYVGFTRAKEHCWCLGDADAVNRAVGKKMEVKRMTNLSILLQRWKDEIDEENRMG